MKYLYSFLLLTFFLFSCQDVIDVDTGDPVSQIVVEAWLDNQPGTQEIRITRSQAYFDNTIAQGITDAIVSVRSNTNNITYDFTHSADGVYQWTGTNFIGTIGEEFSLSIEADGKDISASSTLNRVPAIDSIGIEDRSTGFEEGIYCQFYSRDPSGPGDYYWVKTYKNDLFLSQPLEMNISEDAGFGTDGLVFIPPIRESINPVLDSIGQSPWLIGDHIRVEIHSINKETFDFMEIVQRQLLNSLNTIFAEPLANSPGNIVNNTDDEEVLGIFNVAAISEMERDIE